MNLEKLIIEHCAPTLAKLKTGNLINVKFKSKELLLIEISIIENKLFEKGISIKILKENNTSFLIYIYREKYLNYDLKNSITKSILLTYGYKDVTVDSCLQNLINRLDKYNEFPHEIGLFLGYPPDDVYDFICNKGENSCYCGYWKVYNNVENSLNKFKKFDICKSIFKKRFKRSNNISQLIVV